MINRREFLAKQMGIAAYVLGSHLTKKAPAARTITFSSDEGVAKESSWKRLRRLVLTAGREPGATTVVLDKDIQLVNGDSPLILPSGVKLVPPPNTSVTIDLTRISEPLQRLFLIRSFSGIGEFNIEIGNKIKGTVVDILPGTIGCDIKLKKVTCNAHDPIAIGVWVRGEKNNKTADIDIRIGYSYGLRTGVQMRDCQRVSVLDSTFDNYGHKGVHGVSASMDTTNLAVKNCKFGQPAKVLQSDGYARQPIGFNASAPSSFAHYHVDVRNCVMRLPGKPHDGSTSGKASRSRASADGISLHRAVGFHIVGNEVIGSGELAINASGGSSDGFISHNRTENDDVGAINIGVLSDNTGVNRGGIRNSNIVVSHNSCFRSVSNALHASAPDGKAALRSYSSDDCGFLSNKVERHEKRVLATQVAAIGASASTGLYACDNQTTGFDHLVNEYYSHMGTGFRDVQWNQLQNEQNTC